MKTVTSAVASRAMKRPASVVKQQPKEDPFIKAVKGIKRGEIHTFADVAENAERNGMGGIEIII